MADIYARLQKQIDDYVAMGEVQKAISLLQWSLETNKEDLQGWSKLAELARKKGDVEAELLALFTLAELQSAKPEQWLKLAEAADAAGMEQRARDARKRVEGHPAEPRVETPARTDARAKLPEPRVETPAQTDAQAKLQQRIDEYLAQGNLAKAIELQKWYLEIDKRNRRAWSTLADLARMEGNVALERLAQSMLAELEEQEPDEWPKLAEALPAADTVTPATARIRAPTSREIINGQALHPMIEVAEAVVEAGAVDLTHCYQCGTCSGSCPWTPLGRFNVRSFIGRTGLGFDYDENQDPWACLSCGLCADRCPNEIDIPGIARAVRSIIVKTGKAPDGVRLAISSVEISGNPWSGGREQRGKWAEALDLCPDPGHNYTLFSCCTTAYDPDSLGDGQATVRLLQSAGGDLCYEPGAETCCGDTVLACGYDQLFQRLSEHNRASLANARAVVVTSPHCLNAFRNHYDWRGRGPRVFHSVELLQEMVRDGRLNPELPVEGRVAYHDPCYLGRRNGVYQAPRDLLTSIPGLELVELSKHHEDSLCCGGGGGGIWQDVPKGERLADIRVLEAVERGSQILATACPLCLMVLRSSVTSLGLEERLSVASVSEILWRSVQGDRHE